MAPSPSDDLLLVSAVRLGSAALPDFSWKSVVTFKPVGLMLSAMKMGKFAARSYHNPGPFLGTTTKDETFLLHYLGPILRPTLKYLQKERLEVA